MTKLITTIKISKQVPSIEELAKMLQVDLASKRKRISPEKIINAVSTVFDIKPADILGNRRTSGIEY